MSFILDALKKSEAERQRQAGPALLEMRIVRPPRRLPAWAVAVGVVLFACVIVLAWLAWRPAAGPGSAAPADAPTNATANTPAGAEANGMAHAVANAAANLPAPGGAPSGSVAFEGGAAANRAGATTAAAAPADGVEGHAAAAAPAAATGDGEEARNPADQEPAVAAAAGAAEGAGGTANLHNYAELSGKLPELRLDLHVYAANPADRYAFINMHKVREGDVTAEGLQVKEITRDGVVLDYRGTEFLLGRQ